MKAGSDFLVQLAPFGLGEIGDKALHCVHESEGHGALIKLRRWDEGETWSGLMADETIPGTLVLSAVALAIGSEDGQTDSRRMGMLENKTQF